MEEVEEQVIEVPIVELPKEILPTYIRPTMSIHIYKPPTRPPRPSGAISK
tara:strand:+ start:337 stop:486 length:150 start_codon:yes stop_codon:yes gene_type:complete